MAIVPLTLGPEPFSNTPPGTPPPAPGFPTSGGGSGLGLGALALGALLAILGLAGPVLVAPSDQENRTPSSIQQPASQTQFAGGHANRNLIE